MDFNLNLPGEEEVREQVAAEVVPTQKEVSAITTVVEQKTNEVMALDLDSEDQRRQISKVFQDFGSDVMTQSGRKNSFMQRQLVTLGAQGGESGEVAKSLGDLSIQMRDLDPSGIDFAKTGALGKLFNPARRYFEKYKTADKEISTIVKSLDKGKKVLQNDNTTIELEQGQMRDLTKKLMQNIEMGTQLDRSIEAALEEAQMSGQDEDKIKFIQEELLYPLRQRIEDFQQLLLVNQQGIVAMEIVRKNNKELIRSVDRAKLVTVNALRTAVMVAGALYDEKIVMEKVNALNATTNSMIEATARMLKEQGTEIHRQSSETSISVDTLRSAFADTFQALDDISTYKVEALPRMKATIQEFQALAEESQKHIERMEAGRQFETE